MRGVAMTYHVITHNQIIGCHCWKNAPEHFAYLRDLHRHVFAIRCKFLVTHTDREIEINQMQEVIAAHFEKNFERRAGLSGLYFGSMSCEDIAKYCIERFGCEECEVLEDGFGGALVSRVEKC